MQKIMKKVSGLILVFAIIAVWAAYSYTHNTELVSSSIISNTKIGWGVKRGENHKQPDFGKTNINLMNKYNSIYVGNNEKKYVYLTFDQGYEAGYTEKILDVLKEKEVKAVFFITAHYVNTAGELIERMVDEGHIVRKSYSKS